MKDWNCSPASRTQKSPRTTWSARCVPIGRQNRWGTGSSRASTVAALELQLVSVVAMALRPFSRVGRCADNQHGSA